MLELRKLLYSDCSFRLAATIVEDQFMDFAIEARKVNEAQAPWP
jgi:hypothetical protein